MRLSNSVRKFVVVTNKETGDILEFSSMTDAGKYLGISRVTVNKYLINNLPYKEYTISAPYLINKQNIDRSLSAPNTPFVGEREDNSKVSQQPLLLTNRTTGDVKKFSSITEAAKFLDISRGRLGYFFKNSGDTGNETVKGYIISKIEDTENKIHRKTKKIEVTDIDTNKVTIYSSFTLAGEALGVPSSSFSGYFAKNRSNLFRNKYKLKLV